MTFRGLAAWKQEGRRDDGEKTALGAQVQLVEMLKRTLDECKASLRSLVAENHALRDAMHHARTDANAELATLHTKLKVRCRPLNPEPRTLNPEP